MSEDGDELAQLSTGESVILAIAALFSLVGTLVGLAGLLMWGIRAADRLFPGSGDAPPAFESFAPYLTIFNFVLTVLITMCGVFNLMIATRGREFLTNGWKSWLLFSAISVVAAILFFAMPGAA